MGKLEIFILVLNGFWIQTRAAVQYSVIVKLIHLNYLNAGLLNNCSTIEVW